MGYSSEEKETTCVYDYLTKTWTVYTCVPNHMTKLSKLAEPIWKEEEPDKDGNPRMIAGKWKLGNKQVRFAKLFERKVSGETEEESNNETDDESEDEEE